MLDYHVLYHMPKTRAKDKWGSETEGHKTNGEVDKMDSTNIEVRICFVCMSCLLY